MENDVLKIEVLTTIQEFEKIEKEIDILIQKNNGRVLYLTFDYLVSWLHVFANENKGNELHILVAKKNDRIIGLCPMILQPIKWTNLFPLKVMKFIGEGLWGYADLLILNEFRDEVIGAFLDFLLRQSRTYDRLEIGPISEDSPNINAIRSYFFKTLENKKKCPSIRETWIADAPYVTINGCFTDYKKKILSRNLTHDIERRIRRLKELGTLEYRKITERNQLTSLHGCLEEFFLLHQKEWKSSRFSKIPQYKKLYHEVALRAIQKGFFEFSYLSLNQNMIACHYGFVLNQRLYHFTIAHDIDFNWYAPGKILLYYMMEDAFTHALREFDFLNDREDYKLQWTSDIRKRYCFSVHNWKSIGITFCTNTMKKIVKLLLSVKD